MTSSSTAPTDSEIVANVRARAGVAAEDGGPTDQLIAQGVRGFAREFEYWYNRVLDEAVPKYRKLIIDRINPMIRGMQLEGLKADEVADRLVGDYAHRNYVTAGGWALEQLAIAASPRLRKSTAAGIDAEWHEAGPPPVVNLYVIKSGAVTRNSDILKALKTHGQEAQKRLLQTDKKSIVRVYYIVTAGAKSSTFHDGVHRPSSAEFWAQTFAMDDNEKEAIDLALAMAQEAGALLRKFNDETARAALKAAVAAYIAAEDDPTTVDWEFLAERNMIGGPDAKEQDKLRHRRAIVAANAMGYEWPSRQQPRQEDEHSERATQLAEAAAAISPEIQDDLEQMLPSDEVLD